MKMQVTVRQPMIPCKYTRSLTPGGPRGLAFIIAMIGTVNTSWTIARNRSTSEGSISGRTFTITEHNVKKIPENSLDCWMLNDKDPFFNRCVLKNNTWYGSQKDPYHPIPTVKLVLFVVLRVIRGSAAPSAPVTAASTARRRSRVARRYVSSAPRRTHQRVVETLLAGQRLESVVARGILHKVLFCGPCQRRMRIENHLW